VPIAQTARLAFGRLAIEKSFLSLD